MPILHLPGEIIPGQFGPMTRVFFPSRYFHLNHIGDRNALRDTDDERNPGIGSLHNCVGGKRGRNVNHRRICARFSNGAGDGIENRHRFVRRAAFTGRDAADDICAVFNHLYGMESSFFAGDPLHNQAGILIN
jgi:hypothetical protein